MIAALVIPDFELPGVTVLAAGPRTGACSAHVFDATGRRFRESWRGRAAGCC